MVWVRKWLQVSFESHYQTIHYSLCWNLNVQPDISRHGGGSCQISTWWLDSSGQPAMLFFFLVYSLTTTNMWNHFPLYSCTLCEQRWRSYSSFHCPQLSASLGYDLFKENHLQKNLYVNQLLPNRNGSQKSFWASYLLGETFSALSGTGEYTTVWQGFSVRNGLWPGLKQENQMMFSD